MILLMKTDQAEAYVGLHDGNEYVAETHWQAHRELSDTLLKAIESELHALDADWSDLTGVGIFKGPGSFTGLRIGMTVANTLSQSLGIPIVATQEDSWAEAALERLSNNETDTIAMPEYGGEANITKPRK